VTFVAFSINTFAALLACSALMAVPLILAMVMAPSSNSSRCSASELAADNIRVNAVAPGVIRTPIDGEANVDAFGGVALLNRVGEVQEITEAILHLATGIILPVDGGIISGRN
jgi:NAD(P)-dependent dehydrogenase (short-subunit alcohol dehydrogenase family)